jgi:hypothetical protein
MLGRVWTIVEARAFGLEGEEDLSFGAKAPPLGSFPDDEGVAADASCPEDGCLVASVSAGPACADLAYDEDGQRLGEARAICCIPVLYGQQPSTWGRSTKGCALEYIPCRGILYPT